MAKKVTINGSNLLSSTQDAWGGQNSTQYPQTIHGTTVPPGAEWGMNRGEVERFIKSSINAQQSRVGYYVCDNSASTAAKAVVASGYQLAIGGCVRIKMTNANTANNVTLNINSTGAYPLFYGGEQASSTNTWEAGEVLEVYYDGTQYQCVSSGGGRADRVKYDNSESGLSSDNVQGAIDEVSNELKCFIQQSNFTSEVKKKGQTRTHITPELIAGKTYRFHVVLSSPATGDITPILYVNNNTSDNTYIGLANGRITSGQSEITFDYTPSSERNYQYLGWWSVNDVRTATVTISEGTLLSDKVEELAGETDNMNEAIFSKSDSFNQSIPARSQIRHLFPTELVVGVKYHFILDFTTTTTNKVTIYLYVNGTTEVTDYVKIAEVPSGSTHYEFDYTPQAGSNYQYFGAYNEGVATAVIVEYSWISDESKLTDIEGKIDELYENVFIENEHYTAGACFRDRNFNLTADENYGYTDFWIEVTPNTTILWNQSAQANSYMVVATANMSYSDRWSYTGGLRQISIKSTEKYIRVSFPLSDKKNTWVKDSLGNIIWQPITYKTSEQAIEELRDDMDSSISLLEEELRKEKKKKLLLASFVNADFGNAGLYPENTQYAPKRCWTGYLCLPERTTRIYCKVPDEFQFGIITFTDEPGAGAGATSGWLNPSEGLYYDIPDGKFYFMIGLKKKDDTNFNASYVNELVESGDIEFTYDAVDLSDVYGRNSEQETIARSAMLGTTLATLKSYPKILHISDTHGDGVRFENAMKIADYLDVDAVVHTGDAVANNSRNMAYYIQYLGNKHKTPIFFCLGNHELSGDMPSNTYFIDPLKEKYGYMKSSDTLTDTNYYYHDIASKNIRLIALDQFCGHYGSQGGAGKIGQEQITWLCNTLAGTPANYGVVILMHAPEDVVPKDNTYDMFWQAHGYCQNGMYEADVRPIEKIIDAFISKSTLNLSYTNVQNESVTINADFTSLASGVEFIAYMNGHKHVDQVGYLENATNLQLNLLVTCGIAYYGTTYQGLANFNDCPREPLGQTQDAVSLYVIDRTNGVVKVVRLGAYMRANMTKKDYMAIPYRDTNG